MSLTTRELLYIQDNIKMTENSIKLMQSCAEMASDPQIKGLCQSMAREHQQDLQTLIRHVNASNVQ
ncbi:MAG: hypothetical protein ACOX4M_07030 [Acetivibrionales bacterium]|jgi:hypothetical protein